MLRDFPTDVATVEFCFPGVSVFIWTSKRKPSIAAQDSKNHLPGT